MIRVHVLALGPFGIRVAELLDQSLDDVATTTLERPGRVTSHEWPSAEIRVLATSRATPSVAAHVDRLAWRIGTTWLPVVAEHPYLRVGPVVVPGAGGACHRCFVMRLEQHDGQSALRRAVWDHGERTGSTGPVGHLPHHVRTATAMTLAALRDPAREAGRVRRIHLLDVAVAVDTVIGLHGCSRCGLGRDEATRSAAPLKDEIDTLLAGGHRG